MSGDGPMRIKTANAFKEAQIRYRRRGDDPNRYDDQPEWIDFCQADQDVRIIRLSVPTTTNSNHEYYKGPIFGLKDFPGFVYAPQALGDDIQKELAYSSVTKYCEGPHKTNIDLTPPKPNEDATCSQSIWERWKGDRNGLRQRESKPKRLKALQPERRPYRSFKKLSWATMGYHYDWTERSYNKALKSEMPVLVGGLSKIFATTSFLVDKAESTSFAPTASIVNYYNTKSLMGGHRDDLEFAVDKPIVSFSVGLPAIFLLGCSSKEEGPVVPILIRPGDVMCMGGDSRMNYHGMARVLPACVPIGKIDAKCCPTPEEQVYLRTLGDPGTSLSLEDGNILASFLSEHRINVNVRQVYHDD